MAEDPIFTLMFPHGGSSAKKELYFFWRYSVFALVSFERYLVSHPESN
jgi:hypothetical protein